MNDLKSALVEKEIKKEILLREYDKGNKDKKEFQKLYKEYKEASIKVLDLYEQNMLQEQDNAKAA